MREKLPRLRELHATVIANVWGDVEEDYVAVVRALEEAEGLAGIELNISCPNVEKGGMLFGNSPQATASLVARVRAATPRPLIVKLSPNAPDIVYSARAAHESGADILSLVNTFVGMAIDPETGRAAPLLRHGRALGTGDQAARRPHGLPGARAPCRAFRSWESAVSRELSDVLEFLAAGATAVQVGTANFKEPGVSARLVAELAAYCEERSATVASLVGRAHRPEASQLETGAQG